MAQVFISYSRKDLSFVQKLAGDLKKAGFDVWYDLSGLAGGSRWRTEIENAIKDSQYIVVVLSPDSVKSEWVEREFLFADNRKRPIIPVVYRACELPINYLNLNCIDVQGDKYRENFDEILRALDQHPAPPPGPPSKKNINTNLAIFVVVLVVIGIAIGPKLLAQWNPATPFPIVTETATTAPLSSTPTPVATSTTTAPPTLPTGTSTPALSSDLWITYYSLPPKGNRDIFMINPVTGETRGVITDPSHDKVGTWSPDGKILAFESSRADPNYYQIYLYDGRQGRTTPLTQSAECSNWAPNWSPDGTKIVFYSNCENNQRDIYMVNRDGSGRKRLTTSNGEDTYPAFSPDGNSITFTSTRTGRYQIFLMNADGSNQRVVADGCSSTFSPDGNWLWFSTNCGDSDIKHIKIDGTNLSTIGSIFGHNPSLSPDGQFVAFQSNDDIWIMDVDGSNPTQLTSGSAEDGAPSWKP